MLLGDAAYYTAQEDEVAPGNKNAAGSASVENNNVNVQLLNSLRDFENSTNASFAQHNTTQSSVASRNESRQQNGNEEDEIEQQQEDEDDDENQDDAGNVDYSNSHSFGSIVDIDNQPGYTIGNLSNFNFSNLNLSQNQNYETLDGKATSKQPQRVASATNNNNNSHSNANIYYLNSENQENLYVR